MVDFKGFFINIVVMGVVILGIMSFIIISQTNNNTENLITNNSIINNTYGNLYGNISSVQSTGDLAGQNFGNITPTQSYGIVDVTSVVSPTRLFSAFIQGTYNVLIELPIKILGVPPLVAGALDAIVALIVILGIWAIWRGVAS